MFTDVIASNRQVYICQKKIIQVNLTEKNSIPETEITNEDYCDQQPQVVIDPGRAFCQRIKFVMRMKRRMRDFKSRKEKNQLYLTEQKNK